MLPTRLKIIRPYLASLIDGGKFRPPFSELIYYLSRPGKKRRASGYIEQVTELNGYWRIIFTGFNNPFYYRKDCSWIDLCSTIDECFNRKNWHCYTANYTPLEAGDVVVDCGAAEGLFTFICQSKASQVFTFEPLPKFVAALKKNFSKSGNVALFPCGVGHRRQTAKLTDDEILSVIAAEGTVEVEITTLDEALLSMSTPISFIKADVEGSEYETLLGAEQLIRQYRPKIALTMYHPTNNTLQIMRFLKYLQPTYKFATKGMGENGGPVMLHAW